MCWAGLSNTAHLPASPAQPSPAQPSPASPAQRVTVDHGPGETVHTRGDTISHQEQSVMIITAFSTHCFSECYDLLPCFSHCDDVSYPNVGNFHSVMCPEYIPPTVPALLCWHCFCVSVSLWFYTYLPSTIYTFTKRRAPQRGAPGLGHQHLWSCDGTPRDSHGLMHLIHVDNLTVELRLLRH